MYIEDSRGKYYYGDIRGLKDSNDSSYDYCLVLGPFGNIREFDLLAVNSLRIIKVASLCKTFENNYRL